jgi:hypothetical protein
LLAVVVAVLMTLLLVVLVVDLLEVMLEMLLVEVARAEHNLLVVVAAERMEQHSKADPVRQVAEEDIMVVLVEIPSLHAVLMVQVVEDQDLLVV